MFKLKKSSEFHRRIPKCDFIRCSHAETSTIKTPYSQIYKNIARKNSVISLLNSCLDLIFDVIYKADNSRYGNGNDIRLVKLGPISLFGNFSLRTSSGKHLEDISYAQIVSLLY